MRVLRVASFPIFALIAGCVTTEEPSSLKSGEGVFPNRDQDTIQLAGELALGEAQSRPELFAGIDDMVVSRVNIDDQGEAHARIAQTHGGIPVFEGEAVVHLGRDGMWNSVDDKFVRDIQVDVKPTITADEAEDIAPRDGRRGHARRRAASGHANSPLSRRRFPHVPRAARHAHG
jgi:hypothetical protein